MFGADKFPAVLSALYGEPWLITAAKFAELEAVVQARIRGEVLTRNVQLEHLHRFKPGEFPASSTSGATPAKIESPDYVPVLGESMGYWRVGNAAVIPLAGTFSSRPTLFQEYSGGTSHAFATAATQAALADGKVEQIIYEIDSPGGVVSGMFEGAEVVRAAGKQKPTTGVANFCAASAAYWYLSQCGTAVCTPSGQVGCIGCIVGNMDATEAIKRDGIRADLVANKTSPYKTEGYPQVAVTPERLADLQRQADAIGAQFSEAVAKGRGIRAATVDKDFGQGRMIRAEDALAARMVDAVDSMQSVISKTVQTRSRRTARAVQAKIVEMQLKRR